VSRATIVAAVALLLVACQTTPLEPSDPWAGAVLPAEDPRPAALLAALHEGAATRQSMRGILRFSIDAPDLEFRGTQRVAARRPARLRVEILGLFSQIMGVLATDGRTYQYYEAGSGETEWGRVTPGLLWEVSRIDVEPADAVRLLLGAPVPSRSLEVGRAEERPDGSVRVQLDDARGQARQRFDFDGEGRLRRFEEWDARATPLRELLWDDYRDIDGTPFPHKLLLRFPLMDGEAAFHFQRVELNPELPDEVFVLDLPKRVSSPPGGIAQ
jgi:hypothetical protein